jgi:glycosyltransferase involved in cell wall biosynthesis
MSVHNVLFVSSGNSVSGISPIILNQGNSLIEIGVSVDYFTIKGKGLWGYLKSVSKLRKMILETKPDIVHSHYLFSGLVALLSMSNKPNIISFMGEDLLGSYNINGKTTVNGIIIKRLSRMVAPLFAVRIVKSIEMKRHLLNSEVIPNGVDLASFYEIDRLKAKKKLSLSIDKQYVLFPSNPNRPEKNYLLAQQAIAKLKNTNIELIYFNQIPHELTVLYFNAASVVLLSSFHEGSPNVIKEAMACNVPIVATNVGDVKYIIGKTDGCHICSYEVDDVSKKIQLALEYNKRTNGRKRIIELGLESKTIARRIVEVYKNHLK